MNEVRFGPDAVQDLAARHGTPLFVYDGDHLERRVSRMKEAVDATGTVIYSVKANLNRALLSELCGLGCGFEVASAGELAVVLAAGVPARRVIFAGPGKTETEIQGALEQEIACFNVESLKEMRLLGELAAKRGKVAEVCLRVNPDNSEFRFRRNVNWFGINPFGIEEEQLPAAIDELKALKWLRCKGVHLHSASGILDSNVLCAYVEWLVSKSMRWAEGLDLEIINLGGGWGQPVYQDERPLDLEPIRATIGALRERHEGIRNGRTRLLVESGRFIVGPAGVYVAQVVDVKSCRGTRFIVLDGGINHCLFQSNAFRAVNRPIEVYSCRSSTQSEPFEIVGPLCTPIDKLASAAMLPRETSPGDYLYFPNAGAYCKASSPLNFLGHPWPKEVLVKHGSEAVIANPVTMLQLMKLQSVT